MKLGEQEKSKQEETVLEREDELEGEEDGDGESLEVSIFCNRSELGCGKREEGSQENQDGGGVESLLNLIEEDDLLWDEKEGDIFHLGLSSLPVHNWCCDNTLFMCEEQRFCSRPCPGLRSPQRGS
jgi:hypothetical protein